MLLEKTGFVDYNGDFFCKTLIVGMSLMGPTEIWPASGGTEMSEAGRADKSGSVDPGVAPSGLAEAVKPQPSVGNAALGRFSDA